MNSLKRFLVGLAVMAAAIASLDRACYAIAISPGADSTAALGNAANGIVRISTPGGLGSGSVIDVMSWSSGTAICILTADHVIRDAGGGGSTIYDASNITVGWGNVGGGGPSFTAQGAATQFDLPEDGSSAVDLAIVSLFIPAAQAGMLPANLAAFALPNAAPAANAAITQAGYGLQGTVANVDANLAYVYSPVNGLGAGYGTLKAGPNTVGAGGVMNMVGAVSDYAGQNYEYDGYTNGAIIAGAHPNYNGSTSYIFSGDSGGPSLVGNTIVGVHSSSLTGTIAGDVNSEFAYGNNAAYFWRDVSVFSSVGWINDTVELLCVPEPATLVLFAVGAMLVLLVGRRRLAAKT